jgi:hypothetical protein
MCQAQRRDFFIKLCKIPSSTFDESMESSIFHRRPLFSQRWKNLKQDPWHILKKFVIKRKSMAFARSFPLQAGIQDFVSNRVARLVKSRFQVSVDLWYFIKILVGYFGCLCSYWVLAKRLEVDRGIAMSEETSERRTLSVPMSQVIFLIEFLAELGVLPATFDFDKYPL